MRYTSGSFGTDQEATVEAGAGINYVGPAVNVQASPTVTSYHVENRVGDSTYYLSKCLAGTDSTLASLSGPTFAAGDMLRIRSVRTGSDRVLSVFRAPASDPTNFTQVGSDFTDTGSTIDGGSPGMFSYSFGGTDEVRSWEGVTLGGGTAPSITAQPSNQTVTAPAAATFSVTASGSGTLTYQWQRSTNSGGSWSDISGATASSYTTPATSVSGGSANNGDQYRCVVTGDTSPPATSDAATLTVNPANTPPNWTGTPSAMSAKRGQALTPQDITSLVTDSDTLTYSLSGAPTGVSINSSTGVISGTPTDAPGTYACTVGANDGVNSTVQSASFNITVTQVSLPLDTDANKLIQFVAGSFGSVALHASLPAAVDVYASGSEHPGTVLVSIGSLTTGANGRLADIANDALLYGTTYDVLVSVQISGVWWRTPIKLTGA